MGTEIDFGRRLTELADRADRTFSFVYTDFLNMQELSVYAAMKKELQFVESVAFGGMDGCERCMIRFGNEDTVISHDQRKYDSGSYDSWDEAEKSDLVDGQKISDYTDFPITLLEISPVREKFADDLTHRDFLGSILGLGLEREKTGDIIVRDNHAYAFVHRDIADYIADSLEYVKHTHVSVSICGSVPEDARPKLEKQRLIVSSNRLDAIIARLYKLSREQGARLVTEGRTFVNGSEVTSVSKTLKPGDVVSVRGHGKFIFREEAGHSKKDRLYVDVEVYM